MVHNNTAFNTLKPFLGSERPAFGVSQEIPSDFQETFKEFPSNFQITFKRFQAILMPFPGHFQDLHSKI